VALRTTAGPHAMRVLARAGATVAATGVDTITVSGLTADRIVTLLNESVVPFSEVSAHRATLEDVYLALTREAVEFRAATPTEASR
jgi:ABC-2 type transport system ATP-binding protein